MSVGYHGSSKMAVVATAALLSLQSLILSQFSAGCVLGLSEIALTCPHKLVTTV